jgi:hypothetical protein
MRLRRLAVLIFTLVAGIALTLGILGSCTTTEVGRSLKSLGSKVYS